MVEIGCECNFGIPGVSALPPHDHNAARMAADLIRLNPGNAKAAEMAHSLTLADSIHPWVDWKAVSR